MEHTLKKGPKRSDLPLFLKMTMPRSEWAGDLTGLLPSLVSYNQREEDRKNWRQNWALEKTLSMIRLDKWQ